MKTHVSLQDTGTRFYIRQQEQRWIYVLHLLQPIRFLSKNCREEKSLQDFSFLPCGLIPTFLLIKGLGLYDTPFVLVLLGALNIYNMIIARSFFEGTISKDLMDAAEIDGCGKFRFFISIVLPLSKALIGVLVVYYGVAHWNQYFNALIYISKEALRPLQMVLREILIQNSSTMQVFDESMMLELLRRERYAELIKYGVIVVASIPVLCIYPFIQKYFTKGVMLGAVKE